MSRQPILYLMLGYPGAGKTTTAAMIAKLTGAVHLASDQLRLEMFVRPSFSEAEHQRLYDELDKRTEALLKEGKSVIYDANLNRYEHRQEKYIICERAGAKAVLIWVRIDKDTAKARATDQTRSHLVPPHEAPEAMFERIVGILEPPHQNEPSVEVSGKELDEAALKQALGL